MYMTVSIALSTYPSTHALVGYNFCNWLNFLFFLKMLQAKKNKEFLIGPHKKALVVNPADSVNLSQLVSSASVSCNEWNTSASFLVCFQPPLVFLYFSSSCQVVSSS